MVWALTGAWLAVISNISQQHIPRRQVLFIATPQNPRLTEPITAVDLAKIQPQDHPWSYRLCNQCLGDTARNPSGVPQVQGGAGAAAGGLCSQTLWAGGQRQQQRWRAPCRAGGGGGKPGGAEPGLWSGAGGRRRAGAGAEAHAGAHGFPAPAESAPAWKRATGAGADARGRLGNQDFSQVGLSPVRGEGTQGRVRACEGPRGTPRSPRAAPCF